MNVDKINKIDQAIQMERVYVYALKFDIKFQLLK